ncbi:MAG: 50S ribosomal protein L25, partial [Bacteroidota bacterium]
MKTIAVTGTSRTETGKNAVRKIRKENKVPAVIYGQGEPQLIAVDYLSVKKALFTPESYIV